VEEDGSGGSGASRGGSGSRLFSLPNLVTPSFVSAFVIVVMAIVGLGAIRRNPERQSCE
jgi:hypothetical protein